MDDNKQFNDLYAFIQIAKLGSFSKAAAILNVQPSALSHRMNELEKRLRVKLLNRTTRSVSTTEAGQQLLDRTAPMFSSIQQELSVLSDYTEKMSGKIRINCPERAAFEVIYPKIKHFLSHNRDVKLDVFINNLYVDIIEERFDFGVRSGDDVALDMVAVQISAEHTMSVVTSPLYIHQFGKPAKIEELVNHRSIIVSFTPEYKLNEWEFNESDRIIKMKIPENIVFNSLDLVKKSAIDGLGVTWLPDSMVQDDINTGNLVELFSHHKITYPPLYLYYAKNKHKTPAMTALIELLRWKKGIV